jgi:hypothetical protein
MTLLPQGQLPKSGQQKSHLSVAYLLLASPALRVSCYLPNAVFSTAKVEAFSLADAVEALTLLQAAS